MTGKLARSVGTPWELIEQPVFDAGVRQVNKAILGHNRWATIGHISRQNAHPFDFPNLVGMHNGTLRNKRVLSAHEQYATDSQAVFHDFNEYEPEDVVKELEGAWAFVWVDKTDKTLNFLRNKERTLFYCYNEDRSTMFFASEAGMLRFVLDRHDYVHSKIYPVKEDTLYTFNIPLNWNDIVIAPTQKEVKGKEPAPFVPQSRHNHSIWPGGSTNTGGAGSNNKEVAKVDNVPVTLNRNGKSTTAVRGFYSYYDSNKNVNKWRISKNMKGDMPEMLKGTWDSPQEAMAVVRTFLAEQYNPSKPDEKPPAKQSTALTVIDGGKGVATSTEKKSEHTRGFIRGCGWQEASPPDIGEEWTVSPCGKFTIDSDGEIIDKERFDFFTQDGCCMAGCDAPLAYASDNITFLQFDKPLCEKCYKELEDAMGTDFSIYSARTLVLN
jgi:hypothetical protein